jgi:hypothetical protein
MPPLNYAGKIGDQIHMYSSEDEARKQDKCAKVGCDAKVAGVMVWGDNEMFSPLCKEHGELFFEGNRQ